MVQPIESQTQLVLDFVQQRQTLAQLGTGLGIVDCLGSVRSYAIEKQTKQYSIVADPIGSHGVYSSAANRRKSSNSTHLECIAQYENLVSPNPKGAMSITRTSCQSRIVHGKRLLAMRPLSNPAIRDWRHADYPPI